MKKKALKISAAVAAFLIIAGILFIANVFMGNPVSKMLAKRLAENYISTTYPESDYVLEDIRYDFKEGFYIASIKSPSSIDTHFNAYFSGFGTFEDDSYDDVTDGTNTFFRIDSEYSEMVYNVLEPLENESFVFYSFLEEYYEDQDGIPEQWRFGIKTEDLVLDKKYNVKELAKKYGVIDFSCEVENPTPEKAAKILLDIKERLDKAGVPFFAVDFDLFNTPGGDEKNLTAIYFPYSDIYEEGLAERVKQASDEYLKYVEENS